MMSAAVAMATLPVTRGLPATSRLRPALPLRFSSVLSFISRAPLIKRPANRATGRRRGGNTGTPASLLTTTLLWEELPMQAHTILIVVIFCVVCFLLLAAFFYAFCVHCSIVSSPKDTGTGCGLEREDATYRCSSSENPSAWNAV